MTITKEVSGIKLSIIIPYYKTKEATDKLLKELIKQSTDEVEIILVDDGCNEEWTQDITVIKQNNGGVSAARNNGMDNAKGKYIAFIDSDDFVNPTYIEDILNKIDSSEFDRCYIGWESIGTLVGKFLIKDKPPKWNTCVWNCVYRKDFIGNTRFDVDLQIGEDEKFNNSLVANKTTWIDKLLYVYTAGREDGLTTLFSQKKINKDRISFVEEDNSVRSQIVLYQHGVGPIGGIETFIYEFGKALKDDYDIVFMYSEIDERQLARYKQMFKCVRFTGQDIECEVYINCRVLGNIASNVRAKEYIQMIHADFKAMKWRYNQHSKMTKVVAVSQIAKLGIEKQTGKTPIEVVYNLLNIDKPKRVLNLVSPTRLSKEKGYSRMKIMAKKLNELGIPFTWNVFTTDLPNEHIDGFVFRKARFNVRDYINNADYLVQLSDTESWGYAMAEALTMGIPVIATDMLVLSELGVEDGKNGFVVDLNMDNIEEVVNKAYNADLRGFKYKRKDDKQQWIDIIGKMEKQDTYIPPIYKEKRNFNDLESYEIVKIRVKMTFSHNGKIYRRGKDLGINKGLYDEFVNKGYKLELR